MSRQVLPILHRAQPLAQHSAGVLIASRRDQALDQIGLMVSQDEVSCGHAGSQHHELLA